VALNERSPSGARPGAATSFGEPVALGDLAFTEAWERFSDDGMSALVVLYMTEAMFLPGRLVAAAGSGRLTRPNLWRR
jgi:POT family proton-dependent oligopeptide transporter